jgi:uncharacterized protein YbjT (DUF2867 family)
MLKPKTFATGATAKTDRIVVAELLQAGYPVRALVHHEEGRNAGRKVQGAEIAAAVAALMDRVRRYTALPRNRRTPGNRLRQFAPDSAVWRCEQVMARPQRCAALAELRALRV